MAPRGHAPEGTKESGHFTSFPPRMDQDLRDQIVPTTDPDLCETHSGHSQRSTDAAHGRDCTRPQLPARTSLGLPCTPEAPAVRAPSSILCPHL